MTSSLSVASSAPSARSLPADAVPNPKADEALDIAAIAGLELFDWQADVLRDACAVRADDPSRWAAREVGLIVSRQAGKGSILEVRQLAGLFRFDERLQVHSAHEFRTCYEHFRRIVGLVENCDLLRKQVKIIRTGAGDQAIELLNGNRLRFIARSRASGRGFSADAVYLDEAFHLSTETMGALMPALSARPNPQVWYTSSAPHSTSDVLHNVRRRGIAGEDPRLFFVEWSNSPDVDPTDPAAWHRANPSLGLLVAAEDIAAEQRSLSPMEFARERLGVPEEPAGDALGPIAIERWQSLTDGESLPVEGTERLALDVTPDRRFSTFGIAGKRADGLGHVSVRHREPGTSWVVERAKVLAEGHKTPIIVVKGSPAESLVPDLELAGVPVDVMSHVDYAGACQRFVDAVNAQEPLLRHRGSPDHTAAVSAAQIKPAGDGGFVWSRKSTSSDITPLTTATAAWARVGHGEAEEFWFY
jgi:hypothetical protein